MEKQNSSIYNSRPIWFLTPCNKNHYSGRRSENIIGRNFWNFKKSQKFGDFSQFRFSSRFQTSRISEFSRMNFSRIFTCPLNPANDITWGQMRSKMNKFSRSSGRNCHPVKERVLVTESCSNVNLHCQDYFLSNSKSCLFRLINFVKYRSTRIIPKRFYQVIFRQRVPWQVILISLYRL